MLKFEYIYMYIFSSAILWPDNCNNFRAVKLYCGLRGGLWGCSSCCSYDNGGRSRLLFLYIIASAGVSVAVGVAVAIVIVVVVSVAKCVCSIFKICKLSSFLQAKRCAPHTHTRTLLGRTMCNIRIRVSVCVWVEGADKVEEVGSTQENYISSYGKQREPQKGQLECS